MIRKYSKSYGELMNIKKNFLEQNAKYREQQLANLEIYKKQPKRIKCKLCNCELVQDNNEFMSHQTMYLICQNCGHVNGCHEDTKEFSDFIYRDNNYGATYTESDKENYLQRVKVIYVPKMKFLLESLSDVEPKILDLGAGSGYFCAAGVQLGVDVRGIEISKEQVLYANQMIGECAVHEVSPDDIETYLKETDCNIVSAIGVLEHIYNVRDILGAIKQNSNIHYLYFSVPLFSLTVFLEMVFDNCFHRHLGGAHNHLFTLDSIDYMCQEFGFEQIASWQFGTDIMDMYRMVRCSIDMQGERVKEMFDKKFLECSESLQKIIDERDFCSEVHMLVKILH